MSHMKKRNWIVHTLNGLILVGLIEQAFANGKVQLTEVTDEKLTREVRSIIENEYPGWPTEEEIEHLRAGRSEIEPSKEGFVRWTKRILRPEFIPSDLGDILFGLKQWSKGRDDTLFATYEIDGTRFRLVDTSVQMFVTVMAEGVNNEPKDWQVFIEQDCIKYLTGKERLITCRRIGIYRFPGLGLARIGLYDLDTLQDDVSDREIWWLGNPEILVYGGRICFKITKLLGGGIPVDKEYGIRQRFPPLDERLKNASVDEIIEYLRDDKTSGERTVAMSLLRQSPDADNNVAALVHAYTHAKKPDPKMDIAQTMEMIAVRFGGSSAKRTEEFISGEIASKPGGILQSVLEKVLSNVKKKIESEARDEEDKKADTSAP